MKLLGKLVKLEKAGNQDILQGWKNFPEPLFKKKEK
jgi:hypothetical protein